MLDIDWGPYGCKKQQWSQEIESTDRAIEVQKRFAPLDIEGSTNENSGNSQLLVSTTIRNNKSQQFCRNNKHATTSISNSNTRTNPYITDEYIKNKEPVAVPGNTSYASTVKHDRKTFFIGESYVKMPTEDSWIITSYRL